MFGRNLLPLTPFQPSDLISSNILLALLSPEKFDAAGGGGGGGGSGGGGSVEAAPVDDGMVGTAFD